MRKIFLFVFIAVLILPVISGGMSQPHPPLPYKISDKSIVPLRQLVEPNLQKQLERKLSKDPQWARLVRQKKMAVGIVDISDPKRVKFARVNGNVMMYAASLPKLAILFAACQSLEDGSLVDSAEVSHDMRIMINRSDNGAATRMIDRVGLKKIEWVLTDPRYELYDAYKGGGLWVGKRYAKSGKRYPDPLMGISHGASVTQVCRFYYLLAMGKLVNYNRSEQMLDILKEPEIHHKFVNTLDRIVPDATIYRKSGTWQNWHSDSVLVWGPEWRRYIAAALVEDRYGEQILRALIPAIEEALKGARQLKK